MTQTSFSPVVRHIHKLAGEGQAEELSDTDLLNRFVRERDERAFAALLRRHGALVWSACYSVLQHRQDAEDAFQATFLLLARQAGSIRSTQAVASWLYRIAYRVAVKARQNMTRRRSREQQIKQPQVSRPETEAAWRELQAVLNEEVERLPEKYRAPFLLCCLEGKSGPEAARELGWKVGTVTGRLADARKMLQRRLARRGVLLSAVLSAVAVSQEGAAVASIALAETTVKAALAFSACASGAGVVSAKAAVLAEGMAPQLFVGKLQVLALLLAAGALAGAGTWAHQAVAAKEVSPPAQTSGPGVKGATRPPLAHAEDKASDAVVLSGRVLGPDGSPVSEAKVWLWPAVGKESTAGTKTDADGRFHLAVTKQSAQGGTVVATAEGLVADWRELSAERTADLTLRLVRDDVPVNGHIINLEGKAVAGARVRVLRVEKNPDGDLTPWVEGVKKGYWFQWKRMPPEAIGLPPIVNTDREGRFRLAGVGSERLVFLKIEGPDIEYDRFHVMTRKGEAPTRGGHHGAYPATFDHIAGPGRTASGAVRDRKTGKPLAGIKVADSGGHNWTVTDKDGRYTLPGLPKEERCTLTAGGGRGLPYFDLSRSGTSGPGLGPITADFELERGMEITGQLTEKKTGRPLVGYVWYFPLPSNPHREEYDRITRSGFIHVSDWGTVQPDGSFALLGVPGPAVMLAGVQDDDRFPVIPARSELEKRGVHSWPSGPIHALVEISPSEKGPKPTPCNLELTAGRTRRGTVLGPDGKPLSGAEVAGLYPDYMPTEKLKGAELSLKGLRDGRTRVLVFLDRERKLGKVEEVRGGEDGPITVRLAPLGTLTGRVVDAEGRPLGGHKVAAFPNFAGKGHENLPQEMRPFGRLFGIGEGGWYDMTGRRCVTNAAGHFQLEGLLPGVPYIVVAAEGPIRPGKPATHQKSGVKVEPGKTTDLGDWKSSGDAEE
jgi:RNA polymerase sigma factor (sigma-70 family)